MEVLTNTEYNNFGEYINLEGSELGEACSLLIQMVSYQDYISEEFKEALTKEIKAQFKNFKDNCKIVTKKVKITQIVKELEWK